MLGSQSTRSNFLRDLKTKETPSLRTGLGLSYSLSCSVITDRSLCGTKAPRCQKTALVRNACQSQWFVKQFAAQVSYAKRMFCSIWRLYFLLPKMRVQCHFVNFSINTPSLLYAGPR